MRIFQKLNVDYISKRKLFYIISTTLFVAGLLNIIVRGLELGIDFNGGSEIVLEFQKPIEISDVRSKLENTGLGNVEVKSFGSETGVIVRTELQAVPANIFSQVLSDIEKTIDKNFPGLGAKLIDSSSSSVTFQIPNADTTDRLVVILNSAGYKTSEVSGEPGNREITTDIGIADLIKENLRTKITDNEFKILKEERVGPKVGKELAQNAIIAIFTSLLAILIYLGFRFKFIFAYGAVLALFHDVLITLGLYSILYGLIPGLNLEIDLTIVGAFLTLIGYSVNDTVVVFDRVRENLKLHKTLPIKDVINMSVNRTMSRTILTGGTSLLTLFVLLIFGGEVLRAFAFTLFFGIIIGTYSSIFVASCLVYEYAGRTKKKIQF